MSHCVASTPLAHPKPAPTMLSTMSNDNQKIAALLTEFRKLEVAGAGKADHAQHERRNQLLDELQDAVGLGGKMVMEGDITRRADKILAGR
jgi:hypothetical protein